MERPSAPRPADAPDPVFSFRWSWWRRPASMRWVGDGFDGHMAIAIWTWLRSRPVGAGIGLIAAGSALVGLGVALFLSVSCVVVGARVLSERWRWWAVPAVAPVAAAAHWIGSAQDGTSAVPVFLLLPAAAVAGLLSRRPILAVLSASVLPVLGARLDLRLEGFRERWILASAALFCLVSLPPRIVGFLIAAAFSGAVVQLARTDIRSLVVYVSAMILVFPATAILRAANEPFRRPDPTSDWIAAAHRRPWMAAAAWLGVSFAMAMAVHSPFYAPWLPCLLFAISACTGSYLVAGAPGVVGRMSALVLCGPIAAVLAFVVVAYSSPPIDAYAVPAAIGLSATAGALLGLVPCSIGSGRPAPWLAIAPLAGMSVAILVDPQWQIVVRYGWKSSAMGHRCPDRVGEAALTAAWIVVCLVVARTARSRTTVPDDHPVQQLRQLREGRAEGA